MVSSSALPAHSSRGGTHTGLLLRQHRHPTHNNIIQSLSSELHKNLHNRHPRARHSLILILHQTLPLSIHHLQEIGLRIPSLPKHLPQRGASKRALVGREHAAFLVERDCAGGELERDFRGGGESELVGCVIGGGACDAAPVVAVVDGHVRGGVAGPVDGVEESRIVGVEDGIGAAFVVDIEGAEGFGRFEHGGVRISGIDGFDVCSVGL